MVMGLENVFDPDPTYELTIDNMKKILAIHMRFRCGIPVVIMGETGCGKTRLIRYMCALQAGSAKQRNMLLMKVHGGTSYKDIEAKVEKAEKMASENGKKGIDTVLFFDEANTTEALGMIKEVMVDRRINGRPVGVEIQRLHFIAACNPYRRHTDKMIEKLESAGLGYSVKATETRDKLGKIPLRHLVYRVHALPASMRPLVWDFGQLKPEIEELYIRQIVNRFIVDKVIPGNERLVQAIALVLVAAQNYMRKQQDECSFVSLRDVERAMTVMRWFYQHHNYLRPQAHNHDGDDDEQIDSPDSDEEVEPVDMVTWSLLLSLGVCYHAKLQDRKTFRDCIINSFSAPLQSNGGQEQMFNEIERCQKVLINQLSLGPNIARNNALKENVFMMVVCIELRIPLFVIGKPGSSKSLAKTVVADNMQGEASKSLLFKRFKRAHMVSYQCSPLSTPEGIVATFRQCRRLQENNPGDRYASVVVLDEVGLAEDSPLLPLKTLHALLEDGGSDEIIETDDKHRQVAFIGISNWALDPAKMNRGLMLMRAEPDKKELEESARLVKMVYSIAAKKGDMLDWPELEHAIRRNFGGLDEIDAVKIFREHVKSSFRYVSDGNPLKTLDLLQASLDRKNTIGESRYLLVITENYSALTIVEQQLIKNKDDYVVIFGSSFPKDQEYTQVCRNINQIKICMETGRTVVLLNLERLYESLYDALNQYYVYCAGQKYVDLGLGSHRVKCRVDETFRLIVIAEKDVVYKKFPIPLINRLEKHYLVTSKSLERSQLHLVEELRNWAQEFVEVRRLRHERQE
ncbi:E3 ubiquitin-protein ligase RNF213 [Exaiptasia diaphana]|nr:E3 ubiquitin-protein ligase RNF213 [Exaiptasia diaphana]